jgi:hypothetical protein
MAPDSHPASPSAWPKVIAFVALLLVLLALGTAAWAWQRATNLPGATLDKGAELVREAAHQLTSVAQAFRTRSVREEFLSSAVKVAGTSRLQVATLDERETFRRAESDSAMWGLIHLPDIVVQADVPVEYTYYLDFTAPWEFKQEDKIVTVLAPPLTPNAPAPDISQLTFYTLEGHVWQDDKAVRQRLQADLSAALRGRAQEHTALVREIGRRQLEQFVGKWMADSFSDGRDFHVQVLFPDEKQLAPIDATPGLKRN